MMILQSQNRNEFLFKIKSNNFDTSQVFLIFLLNVKNILFNIIGDVDCIIKISNGIWTNVASHLGTVHGEQFNLNPCSVEVW